MVVPQVIDPKSIGLIVIPKYELSRLQTEENWILVAPVAQRTNKTISKQAYTYGDGSEQTLRHIGDDDTNEEDDSVQPVIAEDKGNDEEGDPEKDGYSCYQVDEVGDLAGNRRLAHLQTRGKIGNTTHHSPIAGIDDDSSASS